MQDLPVGLIIIIGVTIFSVLNTVAIIVAAVLLSSALGG